MYGKFASVQTMKKQRIYRIHFNDQAVQTNRSMLYISLHIINDTNNEDYYYFIEYDADGVPTVG